MEIGGPPDPSEGLFPSAFIQRHPLLIPADTLHGIWVVLASAAMFFYYARGKLVNISKRGSKYYPSDKAWCCRTQFVS